MMKMKSDKENREYKERDRKKQNKEAFIRKKENLAICWAYRKEGFKFVEVADKVSFSLYQIPTTPFQLTVHNTDTCLFSNRLSLSKCPQNEWVG